MNAKNKDAKKKQMIMLRPSVKKIGLKMALIKKVSLSQLIEILIYEYSAE